MYASVKKTMMYFMRDYKIDDESMTTLKSLGAIIGGSMALRLFLNIVRRRSTEMSNGDLDIFINVDKYDECMAIIDRLVGVVGYKRILDMHNDKLEEYNFAGDVKKVVSVSLADSYNSRLDMKIDFVFVSMSPKKFVLDYTDLSITSIYYDLATDSIHYSDDTEADIDRSIMRINDIYKSVWAGAYGKRRLDKLRERVVKYELRGYSLVGLGGDADSDSDSD
jgi:hypothetical protein